MEHDMLPIVVPGVKINPDPWEQSGLNYLEVGFKRVHITEEINGP